MVLQISDQLVLFDQVVAVARLKWAVGYYYPAQGAPEEHLVEALTREGYCQALVALVQPLVQDCPEKIWVGHYCSRLEWLASRAGRATGADSPRF